MNYLIYLLAMAKARLGWLFGKVYLSILFLFFLVCAIRLSRRRKIAGLLLDNFSIPDSEVRFFVAFSVSTILTSLIFHIYVGGMFIKDLLPFFIFPVSIGGGILLSSLITNIRMATEHPGLCRKVISCIVLVFIIIYLMRLNYVHLTKDVPVEPLPGSQILHKYKGHSFVTNYWDSYINYFTDEWAIMVWASVDENSVDKFLNNDDHLFEKDRFTNRERYSHPDFLFFYRKNENAVGRDDPERIFKDYPLVEKGRDFWIFDLRKRAG
ncbi:MAG: hypothetical protein HY606_07565 [Planctomycetes bacterium]|nr:hypothetical protein [Planctomycetota bacterium]